MASPAFTATEAVEGLVALDPSDPRSYRDTLGMFATGVTIITVGDGDSIHGMTANAVMSVSLDPPLVATAIGHDSFTYGLIQEFGHFTINVLDREETKIALEFAGSGDRADLFGELDEVQRGPTGDPLIPRSAAYICCSVKSVHDEGDHALVVGKVEALAVADRPDRPLIFHRGRFTSTTCHVCVVDVDGDLTRTLHTLHLI